MKFRFLPRLLTATFLAIFTVAFSSCATRRMITLADGTQVPPAATYQSAKEMESRGRNSFGVPEASFAFFPEQWTPSMSSVSGLDKKQWESLSGVNGSSFRPSNTPEWDRSSGDPASIRHDCFSVERLFVVPWGSAEGAVGMFPAGKEPKGRRGYRWLPLVVFDHATGSTWMWDSANGKVVVFDSAGRLLKDEQRQDASVVTSKLAGGDVLSEAQPLETKTCRTYLPILNVNFFRDGADEELNFAADPLLFAPSNGRLLFNPPNGGDEQGRRYVALYTEAGVEIYRYSGSK